MIWVKGPRPKIWVAKHQRELRPLCTAHKFISTAQNSTDNRVSCLRLYRFYRAKSEAAAGWEKCRNMLMVAALAGFRRVRGWHLPPEGN